VAEPGPYTGDTQGVQAAYIEELGPPSVIRHGSLPPPVPGPTDVLVDVLCTTVNPVDAFIRSGAYRAAGTTACSAAAPCRPSWPRLLHHTRSPTAKPGRATATRPTTRASADMTPAWLRRL
jgi:hypothetical protein